jgi:hypothetical protein
LGDRRGSAHLRSLQHGCCALLPFVAAVSDPPPALRKLINKGNAMTMHPRCTVVSVTVHTCVPVQFRFKAKAQLTGTSLTKRKANGKRRSYICVWPQRPLLTRSSVTQQLACLQRLQRPTKCRRRGGDVKMRRAERTTQLAHTYSKLFDTVRACRFPLPLHVFPPTLRMSAFLLLLPTSDFFLSHVVIVLRNISTVLVSLVLSLTRNLHVMHGCVHCASVT